MNANDRDWLEYLMQRHGHFVRDLQNALTHQADVR